MVFYPALRFVAVGTALGAEKALKEPFFLGEPEASAGKVVGCLLKVVWKPGEEDWEVEGGLGFAEFGVFFC